MKRSILVMVVILSVANIALATVAGVDTNYDYTISQPWDFGDGTQEQNGTFNMIGNVWEWKMRSKLVVVLMAVAMIVSLIQPATATVVVTCQDLGGGVAQFSYDASDETVVVVGFSLDITVDNGATIESIFDYKTGISTAADPGYGIFQSSIVFGPGNEVIDWGTPVPSPATPGVLPGLGTNGITVEMAALYDVGIPADTLIPEPTTLLLLGLGGLADRIDSP